jgi:hypothetical protein
MKKYSEQLIHIGINFLTLPGVTISNQSSLKFQQEINSNGLEFGKVEKAPDNSRIAIVRDSPSPLQILVSVQQPPVAQLTIIAPYPKTTKDLFIDEVEAVISAYEGTWPADSRQVVHSDGAIRELLEASGEYAHAFQELWEMRLKQPAESLKIFGKPIRGGGLRFVLDPLPTETDPVQIEIKIESYLQDTKKIFVETIFNWFNQTPLNPRERINSMDAYVKDCVHRFILGETDDTK